VISRKGQRSLLSKNSATSSLIKKGGGEVLKGGCKKPDLALGKLRVGGETPLGDKYQDEQRGQRGLVANTKVLGRCSAGGKKKSTCEVAASNRHDGGEKKSTEPWCEEPTGKNPMRYRK